MLVDAYEGYPIVLDCYELFKRNNEKPMRWFRNGKSLVNNGYPGDMFTVRNVTLNDRRAIYACQIKNHGKVKVQCFNLKVKSKLVELFYATLTNGADALPKNVRLVLLSFGSIRISLIRN